MKMIVKLLVTFVFVLALVVPVMAQDDSSTPDPAASDAAEATPVAAPITATTDLFVTTQFRVNVRSGPGTIYTRLGVITFADSLDITGQTEGGDWLRVNFNGQEGWVFANVVEVTGDVTTAPVAEAGAGAVLIAAPAADTEESADPDAPVVVMTRFNTNLRSSFTTNSDVLEIIPFDTQLVPQARTPDSDWVMVTVDEQSGWVFAPILFFSSGVVESLPVTDLVPEAEAPAPTEP